MIDPVDHSLKFGPARRDRFVGTCADGAGRTVSLANGSSVIGYPRYFAVASLT